MGAKPILYKKGFLKFFINPLIISYFSRQTDLIHAFDGWPNGVNCFLGSLLSRKPFVMTIYATYGVLPLYKRNQRWLMKAAYRRSSLNVAISHLTAQRIRQAWPGAEIKVINQGINFDDYQRQLPDEKLLFGEPYILTVATLKPRKGYECAIETFSRLKDNFPGLKWVIVARRDGGEYGQKITALMEQKSIMKNIIWLQDLSEDKLIALYWNAKLFFLPSVSSKTNYFEGFGSVYLEAQACGLPVVSSKGGGQEDAIVDKKTGFLIDEGNTGDFYEAIKKLLLDEELIRKMSQNAKNFAKSMDWQYKLGLYYEEYQKILKN